MAREYFCAYHDLLESLTPYSDAECGRIFRACLTYSKTGVVEEFGGNERYIWPTIKQQIDRDRAAYDAKCEQNRANASDRQRTVATATERYRTLPNASDRQRTVATAYKEKEKEEEKDKGEEEIISPAATTPARDDGLGKVMSFFLDKINPSPSSTAVDELRDYTQRLGADIVLHALGIALDERKTGWSYIRAILQRYHRDGLTTMEAVLAAEQRHEQEKQVQNPRRRPSMTFAGEIPDSPGKQEEKLDAMKRMYENMQKGDGA